MATKSRVSFRRNNPVEKWRKKEIEDKLWSTFSLYIRLRDGEQCVVCGRGKPEYVVQCGHLIKRGKKIIKYNQKNNNCQCAPCNFKHNEYPEAYTSWFLNNYGEAAYQRLVRLSEGYRGFIPTKGWLLKRLKLFTKKLEQLKDGNMDGAVAVEKIRHGLLPKDLLNPPF